MSFSEELQSTWNIELARRLLRRASLDPRLWRKKASATAFRRCGEEIESHMPVRSSGRHCLAARHPTCKRRHRLAARHQLAMERLLRSYLDLYVTTTPVSGPPGTSPQPISVARQRIPASADGPADGTLGAPPADAYSSAAACLGIFDWSSRRRSPEGGQEMGSRGRGPAEHLRAAPQASSSAPRQRAPP
jgi:hypothetical protein